MRLKRQIVLSVMDQALLSLVSFIVGMWLVRSTGKYEYGLYLLGSSVLLYVVGAQNALVTVQMTVLAPMQCAEEREAFCGALLKGQRLIFLMPALLISLGACIVAAMAFDTRDAVLLVGIVSAVSVGTLLKEFYRSYHFQRQNPQTVLIIDGLFCLFWLCGIAGSVRWFSGHLGLVVLAMSGLASLMVGFAASRRARFPMAPGYRPAVTALSSAWKGGRWALVGMTVTWLQDQSYIYLLGMFAGAAASAEAGAARLLLVPSSLVLVGSFRVLMPRWADLRQRGEGEQVRRNIRRAACIGSAAVFTFALVIAALRESAVSILFPKEYGNIGVLVLLWGIICALQAARSSFSIGLQVYHRFRDITLANAASAIIVIVLGAALIGRFGAAGGLMAQIVGECSLMMLLGRAVGNVV